MNAPAASSGVAGRWGIACLATCGAFFVSGIAAAFAADALGIWWIPATGFVAALCTVGSAYASAPRAPMAFASGAFVVGALAAWALIEPSWYPESHPRLAYEPTHMPFAVTLLGGLCGLGAVLLHRNRTRPRA